MQFLLYAAGLIGLCFVAAHWFTRFSNNAAGEAPLKNAEPPSLSAAQHVTPRHRDALDWAVTLAVLACFAVVIVITLGLLAASALNFLIYMANSAA